MIVFSMLPGQRINDANAFYEWASLEDAYYYHAVSFRYSTKLKTNIDYVFILREPYINNRKRIWENYAGMFPNFESFAQVMDQCTENYECLVIDNNSKSNKLQDQVFWYKAAKHGDFKLGSKEFWELSKNIVSDDEDDEAYNPDSGRKKNMQKINVRKSKW